MSQLVWSNAVLSTANDVAEVSLSGFFGDLAISNVARIPKRDQDLVTLPDRRAYRSMSRAGVLLSAAALPAAAAICQHQGEDPFRVGLYGAIHHGPEPFAAAKVLHSIEHDFAGQYKKHVHAKEYLKGLPNLAVAQVSTGLRLVGPTYVFVHSKFGSVHAICQAEYDLAASVIDVALVCAASSIFGDPFLLARARQDLAREVTICEGAAAVVLAPGGPVVEWEVRAQQAVAAMPELDYGIANALVKIIAGTPQPDHRYEVNSACV